MAAFIYYSIVITEAVLCISLPGILPVNSELVVWNYFVQAGDEERLSKFSL